MANSRDSLWGFSEWIGDARKSIPADMLAGFTLWAMIVPEAVAYSNMADAPSSAAGLYGIMIVLPIYALFASSRYLVATSTAAVSVTTASFVAVLSSDSSAGGFTALIMAAAVVYLIFWWFKLGFIANFISEPVSRGFMLGLAIFIVIGQVPKILGVEKGKGNTFEQALAIVQNIGAVNAATLLTGLAVLLVIVGSEKINKRLPGGLIALVLSIGAFAAFSLGDKYKVDMVGALPAGLPSPTLPAIAFSDLALIIPAAIGLVVLAISEATVLASRLALQHEQKLDVDQQFFAFGISNLVGGLFGGLLGAGSTSSTLVNHSAGAKTLMSTIWAALLTLVTVLLFTGLFAYLPEAFLGVLIIHAVWHMLKFRGIFSVRAYSHGEYLIAFIAMISVLLFDVLFGLVIAMALNVAYFAYTTSRVKIERFGVLADDSRLLVPMSFPTAKPLPKGTLALGVTQGEIFYASAPSALAQAQAIIAAHPEAKNIVMPLSRLTNLDFTSLSAVKEMVDLAKKSGRKLYITDIRSDKVLEELKGHGFDEDVVDLSVSLDFAKLGDSEIRA